MVRYYKFSFKVKIILFLMDFTIFFQATFATATFRKVNNSPPTQESEIGILSALSIPRFVILYHIEALKSVMCDVINIRLKRRIATSSGKGNN